jgi:CRP-like cAMP-binding protein
MLGIRRRERRKAWECSLNSVRRAGSANLLVVMKERLTVGRASPGTEASSMELSELARRLRATTAFSTLSEEQIVALLRQSPRRQVTAGAAIADSVHGLDDHLVLVAGELEARRTWTTDDYSENSYAWRVAVKQGGPGFAVLSASGSRISVRALVDCDYVAVSSEELDELQGWNQLAGHTVLTKHRKVFHQVPLERVQQVFERMTERTVAAGETIVTQGEPGDSYYIILSGEAEVWVTDPLTDETSRVAVLRDDDAFGEESLLLDGNRTATVTMTSPGRLLVLSKADFDELLKPTMVASIDPERAHRMLLQQQAKLLDCRYEMEYEERRIPGARLVPLARLRQEGVFQLDPEPTYIVYCLGGRRSNAAAFLLRERGIRAISLQGGIKGWPYEVDETPVHT